MPKYAWRRTAAIVNLQETDFCHIKRRFLDFACSKKWHFSTTNSYDEGTTWQSMSVQQLGQNVCRKLGLGKPSEHCHPIASADICTIGQTGGPTSVPDLIVKLHERIDCNGEVLCRP